MSTNAPPDFLVDQMAEFVDQFTVAIAFIPNLDSRDPPGDHQGTGWLAEIDEHPVLCTCEHVARLPSAGQFGYTCFGADSGVSVGSKFEGHPLPVDFAIASLASTWRLVKHKGRCIPSKLMSEAHRPVEGEYLYFYGFPSVEAKAAFGQHRIHGTGVFLHEIEFDESVLHEDPRANPKLHIMMSLSPAHATPLTPQSRTLPLPHGMSGSALWNTRYREVSALGQQWQPTDARLTGIVWGASQKTEIVLATPIEKIKSLMRLPV